MKFRNFLEMFTKFDCSDLGSWCEHVALFQGHDNIRGRLLEITNDLLVS